MPTSVRLGKTQRGFTLAEILIVSAFVSLLLGVSGVNVKKQIDRGNDTKRKTDLSAISKALEEYTYDHECYPTQESWDQTSCTDDQHLLSPYLRDFPCDPVTKTKYFYQTTDAQGNACDGTCGSCDGYRLLAKLSDESDEDITRVGCDPREGCGVSGSKGEKPNWGLAMGNTVPVPGFVPGQGQDTGHTDKHDCKHSKDPECVTPTVSPSPTVSPTPTTPGYCLAMPIPNPTPYPLYPGDTITNYLFGPGSPPIGTPDVQADFDDIIRTLEWYNVYNGHYPDCNCDGWAKVDACLRPALAAYTVPYPDYIKLRQISWPNATTYSYRYYAFDQDADGNYHDYCIATPWAWGLSGNPPWNQRCPAGIPDSSYIWLKKSPETVIRRKPNYANVYPLLPSAEGQLRDTRRKQDLLVLQNAIEAYKKDNGHYPFPTSTRFDLIHNLVSYQNFLVPKYLPAWIDDPYGEQYAPHAYDVWISPEKDTGGYTTKYCLMAYMDENTNCSHQCPDFPWLYLYEEAFCYYKQSP